MCTIFLQKRQKFSVNLVTKGLYLSHFALQVVNRVQFRARKLFHYSYEEFNFTNFNRNHSKLLNSQNQSFIKSAFCPSLSYPPGFLKTYGNVSNGYTWKCESCPVNHFKSAYGNTACKPCSGRLSVNNKDRTGCLDPYTDLPLQFSSEKIFVISICCVGMIGTLLTLLVFLRQKNSPIVSLSDFKLSVGHLILMVFIFVTVMFSMLWQQNHLNQFCVVKVLFVSIAYVFNVGIVFIKSQELLQAFLSKIRLTSGEIKRTIATQIFAVILFLTAVNSIFAVSAFQQPIKVLEITDLLKMTRQYVCNTSYHLNFVIVSTMALPLLCSIQAFRGRNLPSVMNDGIMLTYTTFALTVVFGVNFPIVYYQMEPDKEIFQLGAVAFNNFIISFLMYGQKSIRMIVYPKQNTKAYFKEQSLTRVNQQTSTV